MQDYPFTVNKPQGIIKVHKDYSLFLIIWMLSTSYNVKIVMRFISDKLVNN